MLAALAASDTDAGAPAVGPPRLAAAAELFSAPRFCGVAAVVLVPAALSAVSDRPDLLFPHARPRRL